MTNNKPRSAEVVKPWSEVDTPINIYSPGKWFCKQVTPAQHGRPLVIPLGLSAQVGKVSGQMRDELLFRRTDQLVSTGDGILLVAILSPR